MLIYKGMNLFPTAVRDVVAQRFGDRLEPTLRIVKPDRQTVRFDAPIPTEVEALPGVPAGEHAGIAAALEQAVREQLQVRLAVTVLAHGGLPKGAYKNALVTVKE